jgi:hypothetical protein
MQIETFNQAESTDDAQEKQAPKPLSKWLSAVEESFLKV